MEETPMLFPVTQVEFWKQMKRLIEEVMEEKLTAGKTEKPASYLPEKTLLKAVEVCEIFQVSKPTLYEWMRQGRLKSFKVRSRRYFSRTEIEAIIEQPRP
jgi:excisionase family DNA binding protein